MGNVFISHSQHLLIQMKNNLKLLEKSNLRIHIKYNILKSVILPKCNFAPLIDKTENINDYDLIDIEVGKFI
jgi:hypothetical protein